ASTALVLGCAALVLTALVSLSVLAFLQKGLTDPMISGRRIGWLVRRVARKSGFVPRSPAPPGGSCTSLLGSFAGIV
ncbi:hypothetical protein ACCS63_37075, partial [Rhizobium brockwellii]|uniref:hypothetical protein n=1 Tax=Rhizobium brockwellii TaxID=3019932 RepID=UPI003F95A48C